jgi:hypothetical protein
MRFIPLILFVISLNCKPEPKKQNDIILATIKEPLRDNPEPWIEYSTKNSIPGILVKKLDTLSENSFELANPNESFQHSDVVNNNNKLPWRQLRFLGNSGKIWIMTYKHGGIGLHYHFVICKISDTEIRLFKTGVSLIDLETIPQIKTALSAQKIEFKDIDSTIEVDKI